MQFVGTIVELLEKETCFLFAIQFMLFFLEIESFYYVDTSDFVQREIL